MTVAVLGAGGLLGAHVVASLRAGGTDVRALTRAACDVARLDAVVEQTAGAVALINCAAFTNVDGAETDEAGAFAANALGAENVARAAKTHGAFALHISTDFVFDGADATPYDEFATPKPISLYGRSKYAGEVLFERAGGDAVVRVQGLYGRGGRNFSSKLVEYLRADKPLRLDNQRRVQPSWAGAVAAALTELVARRESGVFHVSCAGETTWAGFAHAVCERLKITPRFAEVSSADLATPAPRPPNCVFAHRMLALRGLPPMPSWQDALDSYLEETS